MKGEIINEMACRENGDTSSDEDSDDELDKIEQANYDLPFKYLNETLKLKLCKLRGWKNNFHDKIVYQNDKYLVINEWTWGARYFVCIYEINDMITRFNYGPIEIRREEYDYDNNKIKYNGKIYEIDYWFNNNRKIKEDKQQFDFMKDLHDDRCFLKKLFLKNIAPENKEKAKSYLEKNIKLECVGKTSGHVLNMHLSKYLTRTKDDSDDELCCEWFVNRMYNRYSTKVKYYSIGKKEDAFKAQQLSEINLGFIFGDKYEMIVHVPMRDATDKELEEQNVKRSWSTQYILDKSCPWNITINKL